MLMKRYSDWSIHWKIMVIPLITLILIVAGTEFVVMPRISAWLMEQEMVKVRNVVEVAYQQIVAGAESTNDDHVKIEEAQNRVKLAIKQMRYNGVEYFWINDLEPRMIMHPTKPELDGSDLSNYQDPNGKRLFVEFVKTCKENNEGFVSYMWPKPGVSIPSPKISYVKLYKPWGWIIGSGLYVDTFKTKVQNLHWMILGAMFFVSCALLLLAWSVASGIKRSVDEGQGFAAAVASGDLNKTLNISCHDEVGELGDSLNSMVADLRVIISHVGATSGNLSDVSTGIGHASSRMVVSVERQTEDVTEITAASHEISQLIDHVNKGVNQLNSSAEESSSSVTELATSIEEVARNMEMLTASVDGIGSSISQMSGAIRQIDHGVHDLMDTSASTASSMLQFDTSIRQIEAYAKESALISGQVRSDAESGKQAVADTISGIGEIMHASRTTAESIGALSEKAKNIGSIVTVIDEIAHQTSLLALNASIIAAQAGVHGRSFGVVAVEIKQLAERTTRSTREIGEVIKGVQTEVTRAVNSIGAAADSINNGEQLSHQAGAVLEKIVDGVNRTAQQMAEIARATKEQSKGSEMIRSAMEQIAEMATAIANSTDQQREGSGAIQMEADKVRMFSAQVMNSMQEQANVGEMIRQMAQEVSDMSSEIRQVCEDQNLGSQRIVKSVERIRQSAADVRQETQVIDNEVVKLGKQSELLQKEMSNFKV
jgi:methyl-accepting chemotaxis protein